MSGMNASPKGLSIQKDLRSPTAIFSKCTATVFIARLTINQLVDKYEKWLSLVGSFVSSRQTHYTSLALNSHDERLELVRTRCMSGNEIRCCVRLCLTACLYTSLSNGGVNRIRMIIPVDTGTLLHLTHSPNSCRPEVSRRWNQPDRKRRISNSSCCRTRRFWVVAEVMIVTRWCEMIVFTTITTTFVVCAFDRLQMIELSFSSW